MQTMARCYAAMLPRLAPVVSPTVSNTSGSYALKSCVLTGSKTLLKPALLQACQPVRMYSALKAQWDAALFRDGVTSDM